ncbi:MAG: UDP-N-acetylmuramate dehydrogenase [Terriglobales bacterium]
MPPPGSAPAVTSNVEENVALAPLTTFGIGGPARYFSAITAEGQIPAALEFARRHQLPIFVLGGGSNILVSDAGFPGLVLAMRITGWQRNGGEVQVAAGQPWDDFVGWCVGQDLAGLECLSSIPGLVGGTPIQNVGAYGQEVAETITAVRVWDGTLGQIVELGPQDCHFAYRSSRFNTTDQGRFIVVAVRFGLRSGGAATVRYPEVKRRLPAVPTLSAVRTAVQAIRREKGMTIEPGQSGWGSAGSYFKNPILTAAEYEDLVRGANLRRAEHPPLFAGTDGQTKTSAAWLIERAGFGKGFRPAGRLGQPGPVGLSPHHALALVNYGAARAADIQALQQEIQRAVKERFGIQLEPEPIFVA